MEHKTKSFVVTGELMDERTVVLDETLPLSPTRVRLVLEPLSPESRRPYQVMAEIRQRQKERGYLPPSREEVDSYLKAERDGLS